MRKRFALATVLCLSLAGLFVGLSANDQRDQRSSQRAGKRLGGKMSAAGQAARRRSRNVGLEATALGRIADKSAAARYSPSRITSVTTEVTKGDANPRHISTSYVERQNWTVRTNLRRSSSHRQRSEIFNRTDLSPAAGRESMDSSF